MHNLRKRLLFRLLMVKSAYTFFALYVFSQYSTLADMAAYTSGVWSNEDINLFEDRTRFIGAVANYSTNLVGELATNLLFSCAVAFGLWFCMNCLSKVRRELAWLAVILPSFGIWTSIVSKEALATVGACFLLFGWYEHLLLGKGTKLTLAFMVLGLALYAFIRPHYAIGAFWLILMTWLLDDRHEMTSISSWSLKGILGRLSIPALSVLLVFIVISFSPLLIGGLEKIARTAIQYFPEGAGNADRHSWLGWTSTDDYWINLWWGWIFGMIGPLPSEIADRLINLPFFIEGLLLITFFIFCCIRVVRYIGSCEKYQQRFLFRVLIFALIPAVLLIILVHSPLAMPNYGSGIRYRTAFEVFLTIAPLLIWQASVELRVQLNKGNF